LTATKVTVPGLRCVRDRVSLSSTSGSSEKSSWLLPFRLPGHLVSLCITRPGRVSDCRRHLGVRKNRPSAVRVVLATTIERTTNRGWSNPSGLEAAPSPYAANAESRDGRAEKAAEEARPSGDLQTGVRLRQQLVNFGVVSFARVMQAPESEPLALRCECGAADCALRLTVRRGEYEAHAASSRLLVAHAHVDGNGQVVFRNARYAVVQPLTLERSGATDRRSNP
jgi:hypothetical protein